MKNILLSTAVVSLLAACGGSGASDTITPDDAHIDLSKEKKGSVVINTPNGRLHGYNQYASFYGVWVDDNKAKRELRYRGDKTVNVPQSGKAVYHGSAFDRTDQRTTLPWRQDCECPAKRPRHLRRQSRALGYRQGSGSE